MTAPDFYKVDLHLKEIVFQEVSHRFKAWDGPPRVKVKVQKVQPDDQHQRAELRLVADSNQDHERGTDDVLKDHGN